MKTKYVITFGILMVIVILIFVVGFKRFEITSEIIKSITIP